MHVARRVITRCGPLCRRPLRAAGPRILKPRYRHRSLCGSLFRSPRLAITVAMAVVPLGPATWLPGRAGRALVIGCGWRLAHPGDALADQCLDCGDGFAVRARDDRDRSAAAPGPAGAADAMHVIVGMVRHVEIEDVADVRNVETARRDVRRDQEAHVALAEGVERRHALGLAHVAMQRRRLEAMANERAMQLRDLALAIAEYDGVLEVLARTDETARVVALFVRLASGRDQEWGAVGIRRCRPRPRRRDLDRMVQELLGDAPDLRRHRRCEEQGLTGERHELADALDVRNEAHVEHAVGFIDHQELDAGE